MFAHFARLSFVVLLVGGFAVAQPAVPEIKPTAITLAKENTTLGEVAAHLSKSPAGAMVKLEEPRLLKAKCSAAFEGIPFWEALESAADQTKTRIALRDGGRTVVLESRPDARELSAVSGAFRIVPRAVNGRLLLDQAAPFHEIQFEVHWEPRMPVFRIDSQPRITKAADDRGTVLSPGVGGSRHYPSGSLTDMKVRLDGLTRASKHIATLAGEFRATAAEKMLKVDFPNLNAKLPLAQINSGVKVVLKSFEKIGGTWDAELTLTYPETHPNFESFEEQKWLRDNRLKLIGPDASIYEPESEDVNASGRTVTATYRFKLLANANPIAKNWSIICETPSPLVEMKVPFVLKDIPIP